MSGDVWRSSSLESPAASATSFNNAALVFFPLKRDCWVQSSKTYNKWAYVTAEDVLFLADAAFVSCTGLRLKKDVQ